MSQKLKLVPEDQEGAGEVTPSDLVLQAKELDPLYETPVVEIKPSDLVFQSKEDAVPQLDPLYEAAIIERLQFDGDAPELRTGPLPDGIEPAVPVETSAVSPVAVGSMLEQAASEVQEEIGLARERQRLDVESVSTSKEEFSLTLTEIAPAEIEGYRAGSNALARTVQTPSGAELVALTDERKAELSWKFISTTQGRRSVSGSLGGRVVSALADSGITVTAGSVGEDASIKAEWTTAIDGPNSTQPKFSFVQVASKAITESLRKQIGECDDNFVLEIVSIGRYSEREVGWQARLEKDGSGSPA